MLKVILQDPVSRYYIFCVPVHILIDSVAKAKDISQETTL